MNNERFSTTILQEYTNKRLIRSQAHPYKDLRIYNYTEITQYSKAWDDITSQCRGLILDTQGNVAARSFKKFHNIEENLHCATDDFVIQEKLDGSLIIVFWYDDEWIVASRGSFISDQSKKARGLIAEKYTLDSLNRNYSYVFEILYPENRIVLDYEGREELVFLACFRKDGQEVLDDNDAITRAGFQCVKHYHFTDYTTIQSLDWSNAEGFVVRFSNGERVKIKFQQYVQLHRAVTNLSTRTIWQWFHDRKEFESCLEEVPDEWSSWVKEKWVDLETQYAAKLSELRTEFDHFKLQSSNDRRKFAELILDSPYKAIYFLMLDNRDPHEKVCCMLRPQSSSVEIAVAKPHKKRTVQNTKPTITIMVGISGSGKSTWARTQVQRNPGTAIVSRDALRMMCFGYAPVTLHGYYDHPLLAEREVQITALQYAAIESALQQHLDVIVDDTNLKVSTINGLLQTFKDYEFKFEILDCAVQTAIAQDASRQASVGAEVIKKQYSQLQVLKSNFNFSAHVHYEPIVQNTELPRAYIFDLDGTLANNEHRHVFDWSAVIEDTVHEAVRETLIALHEAGATIIICSGRDSVCLRDTAEWLSIHSIPHKELHMREEGDMRADYVVKEEFWRSISQRYYIKAMFDDRNQVVKHARKLGFTVFQVAEGNF